MDADIPSDSPCLRCRNYDPLSPIDPCIAGLGHFVGTVRAHKCWEYTPQAVAGDAWDGVPGGDYCESLDPERIPTDVYMSLNGGDCFESVWSDDIGSDDIGLDDEDQE